MFTTNNPQSETPEVIVAAILSELTEDENACVKVIGDRHRAIVLFAYKSHERYQEIVREKRPLDDCQCARDAFCLSGATRAPLHRIWDHEVLCCLSQMNGPRWSSAPRDMPSLSQGDDGLVVQRDI